MCIPFEVFGDSFFAYVLRQISYPEVPGLPYHGGLRMCRMHVFGSRLWLVEIALPNGPWK